MSNIPQHLPCGSLLQGGKYRIVRFIAAGGFGCTYEAEHVLLEKRVAIKEFFMQDYCNREDYTNRVTVGTKTMHELVDKYKRKFIGEAKALSGLEHEGIVSVSDVFEENGTAYFVMDYVDGQPLSSLCKNGPLPEKHALYYIRQVCEALAYVHEHNRLHLDIKPGNIMVKSDGRTVLIDFGASKQYDAASGENTTTLLGYTPGYAPLEQMRGDIRQFLPATDIYAIGATLYCLLTGKEPNNEEDEITFPVGISAATRHAVERALEVRKKDRPQSVREFMALLDAPVKVKPMQSNVVPKPTPVKAKVAEDPKAGTIRTEEIVEDGNKPVRRRKKLWFWLVGGLISVATVIAGIVYMLNMPTELSLEDLTVSASENEYDYVDLGLSVKWATCNLGASRPEEYGNYYTLGETIPIPKSGRRLPTADEFDELINNCDYEWTTQNGVAGMRFISKKNGNSVFFPAAGKWFGGMPDSVGEYGHYWSSTHEKGNTLYEYNLYFFSGIIDIESRSCDSGLPVRPVIE